MIESEVITSNVELSNDLKRYARREAAAMLLLRHVESELDSVIFQCVQAGFTDTNIARAANTTPYRVKAVRIKNKKIRHGRAG